MAVKERDVVLMGKDGADQTIDLPVTRLGLIEDGAEVKTGLVDADAVPVVDSADGSEMKKITWANVIAAIKSKLNSVYAAASHTHAWSAITGKPTSMTPTAHKATHKTGGADALTPADIGADPAGSAAAVDTKLTSHTGNKSNPHGVTAAQVGARPSTWTPSKADVGLSNVPNVATNDQTPTFTQATTRANLVSGEKLSVLLGKIMKWFADLKAVAFTGAYADLTGKPTSMTPTAHKASHKTGGTDALTPADIGAAAASHGTHVTYSTAAPVMDGAAAVGTASTVARGDHRHPTDTTRAAKSTLISATIGTSWGGAAGAWTQTLSIAGATATNVVEVFLAKGATDAQDEAFTALQLRDGGQAAGSITLKARGEKNTISIPISVIVRGDM